MRLLRISAVDRQPGPLLLLGGIPHPPPVRGFGSGVVVGVLLGWVWLSGGAAAQQTIHVPADQPTIQAGINAASNGDTVLVAPGTYKEYIDFHGKAITVTSSGGAAATIIDSGGAPGTATVNFLSGELRTSVLSNFTIQDGGAANSPNSLPFGGIFVQYSAPSILNNTIVGNVCSGVAVFSGAALIQGNTVSGTQTLNGNCPYSGAGVLLSGGSTVRGLANSSVTGNTIQNNVQGLYAGGVVVTDAAGSLVQDNTISNNSAGCAGNTSGDCVGGILAVNSDAAVIQGNKISGNSGGCAGGVQVDSSEGVAIQNNTIDQNSGGCAGGISVGNTNAISILQNLVYGNSTTGSASSAGGIGILVPGATTGNFIGIIAGNTLTGNSLGAYTAGESATEINLGGNLGQYVVIDNIIAGSSYTAPALNCSVRNKSSSVTPLVIDHDDIYNALGAAYGGACPDQTGSYGNLSADPEFANASGGSYQLRAGSPAIDAGNNSAPSNTAPSMPATDLGGAARVQDATGKGYPVVDMGAYEFAGKQDAAPTTMTLNLVLTTPDPDVCNPNVEELLFTIALSSAVGAPSGPVTLFMDGVPVDAALGSGTFQGGGITPGLHAFVATYAGSGGFPPSVSVKFYYAATANGTGLTLASSLDPSDAGQSITYTVTASAADGTIPSPITLTTPNFSPPPDTTVTDLIPSPVGVATYAAGPYLFGVYPISAVYTGDATHACAIAMLTQTVESPPGSPPTLVSSANPSLFGEAVTFTAIISNPSASTGLPTGAITFSDGTTILGTVKLGLDSSNTASAASFTTATLAAGSHVITATYTPTGSTSSSASVSLTQVVTPGLAPTNTSLTVCIGPTVYCPATGQIAAPLVLGLTESYGQTFNEAAQVTSSEGGTPTGTISFVDLNAGVSTTICVIPAAPGNYCPASTGMTFLPGANIITAVYSGDATHMGSTSDAVTITMTPDTTTGFIGSSASPSTQPCVYMQYFGQPVTFTAYLYSQYSPPGAVLLLDEINAVPPPAMSPILPGPANVLATLALATSPSNSGEGIATFTTSSLSIGLHTIAIYYAGNADFDPFENTEPAQVPTCGITLPPPPILYYPIYEIVLPFPTSITLSSSVNPSLAGQAVTFTATVEPGVPTEAQITGTVTFYDGGTYGGNGTNFGGTALGAGTLSSAGVATVTTSALAIGNHSISAVYNGTTNSVPSNSAILDQLVTAPPAGSTIFAIGVTPTVTVGVGKSVSFDVTITPLNGFPQGVTLGCSNLPPETTCTFANPVIPPGGGSTTLLLSTTAPHSCGSTQPYFEGGVGSGPGVGPLALPVLAGVVAVLLPGRRRWLRALIAIAAVAGVIQISGCDNCTDLGTRPNTYTIQVTGTAAGVTQVQTQNIVLTVTI